MSFNNSSELVKFCANSTVLDYGSFASERKPRKAYYYCISEDCCFYVYTRSSGQKVKKWRERVLVKTPGKDNTCPHCHNYLLVERGE